MQDHNLRKFAVISKAGIIREDENGNLRNIGPVMEDNPLLVSTELRRQLKEQMLKQDFPFMMKDAFDVCFAAVRVQNAFFYIGPMSMQKQTPMRERQFYRSYGVNADEYTALRYFTVQETLYIVELVAETLTGKAYPEMELLYLNHYMERFDSPVTRMEQAQLLLKEEDQDEDDSLWRHTYREEKRLMAAVREGLTEEALHLCRQMDEDTGRLSSQEINHWRNLAVIGIALVSRAAIEGRLSPRTAYRVSGYYIAKCDAETSVAQIIGIRDNAVRDLTTRVNKLLEEKHTSSYIEDCKTYIARHYREKIYLDTIAEELGISSSYLSRLFHRETGMRLQDYVTKVRIDHAANLLRYSDRSLTDIAHYVNFPSQSYLGRVFVREMKLTPKEYRNLYHASKWG